MRSRKVCGKSKFLSFKKYTDLGFHYFSASELWVFSVGITGKPSVSVVSCSVAPHADAALVTLGSAALARTGCESGLPQTFHL